MNRNDKNMARKGVLGLFRASYPQGCIKLSNETKEHFRVKCEVAHWFYKNEYQVWSEATFNGNKGRPDLVVLHSNGDAYAVEILKSETEARFLEKKGKYPLPIIKIYVSEWDYSTFAI